MVPQYVLAGTSKRRLPPLLDVLRKLLLLLARRDDDDEEAFKSRKAIVVRGTLSGEGLLRRVAAAALSPNRPRPKTFISNSKVTQTYEYVLLTIINFEPTESEGEIGGPPTATGH